MGALNFVNNSAILDGHFPLWSELKGCNKEAENQLMFELSLRAVDFWGFIFFGPQKPKAAEAVRLLNGRALFDS